jgi:hypothetical protein
VFHRWKRRYEDEGIDGLKDRSSAPLHCPASTPAEVVEKIIHLRQHYHFGPLKIEMYLRRYHDPQIGHSTAPQLSYGSNPGSALGKSSGKIGTGNEASRAAARKATKPPSNRTQLVPLASLATMVQRSGSSRGHLRQ